MTIFDIKPYSHWRAMYRTAYLAWQNLGQDTPRTVLKLYLLEYIVRYQQGIIDRLSQQNGPKSLRTPVLAPNTPAGTVAHEIEAIAPVTKEGDAHAATA